MTDFVAHELGCFTACDRGEEFFMCAALAVDTVAHQDGDA